MSMRQVASRAGTIAVAIVAAAGSYSHMRELAMAAGQPEWLATILPASVDGMMIVASAALTDGRRVRWPCWLAMWAGIVASLAANVLVARPDPVARAISAWPALALLLVVEILMRSGGRTESADRAVDNRAAETVEPLASPGVAGDMATDTPRVAAILQEPVAMPRPASPRPSRTRPADTRPATAATGQPDPRVVAMLTQRPAATGDEVAALLGVSGRTARRRLATAREALAAGQVPEMAAA